MASSILADKLHEYPQQDVVDGTDGGRIRFSMTA